MDEDTGQCGATGAAQLAQDAGVKKLVLAHIGPNLSKDPPSTAISKRWRPSMRGRSSSRRS